MEPTSVARARIGYEAHYKARRGLNLSGEPLWTWDQLSDDLKESWVAAGAAIALFEAGMAPASGGA